MRIQAKAAQGMTAVILALSIVTAVFFINLIIKKSIEKENSSGPVPLVSAGRHGSATNIKISPSESGSVSIAQSNAAVPSKTGQKTGKIPDKEIIYEPSIKGNLLIQ